MNRSHPYVMPGIVADDKQYWWHLKDKVTLNTVMNIIAQKYKISNDHLIYSMKRTGPIEARGLCYFILVCKLGYSQAEVTLVFKKNRGTIFHAIERTKFLLKNSKLVYESFIILKDKLENSIKHDPKSNLFNKRR